MGREPNDIFRFVPTGELMNLTKVCRLYGLEYRRVMRRIVSSHKLEDAMFCGVGVKGKLGPKVIPDWWGTQIVPMIRETKQEIPYQKSINFET